MILDFRRSSLGDMGILTHLLLPRRYGDRRNTFIPPNPQPNLENVLRRPTADPPQPVPGPSPTHVAEARRLPHVSLSRRLVLQAAPCHTTILDGAVGMELFARPPLLNPRFHFLGPWTLDPGTLRDTHDRSHPV